MAHSGNERAETWADWAAPSARPAREITRDELITLLHSYAVGQEVKDSTLRHWEQTGLLPRPHARVRDGVYRPLYPIWAVSVIMDLRFYQQQEPDKRGAAWRTELRGRLRRAARQVSLMSGPNAPLPPPPVAMYATEYPMAAELLTKDQLESLAFAIETALLYRHPPDNDDPMAVELSPLGRSPFPLVSARITVIDSQGVEMTVEIPLSEPDDLPLTDIDHG